jgi:hypothetical protein
LHNLGDIAIQASFNKAISNNVLIYNYGQVINTLKTIYRGGVEKILQPTLMSILKEFFTTMYQLIQPL